MVGARSWAVGAGLVAAGILIGGIGVFHHLNMDGVSAEEAGDKVVSTLEAQTGNGYSVLSTEKDHGVYIVDVQRPDERVATYYVTRDGARISSNLNNLNRLESVAVSRKNLSSCMQQKNVVFFGNISQRRTLAQIQTLGGQRYVSGLYTDVNNPQVMQTAVGAGVSRIPALFYNGSVIQGVNSPSRIANFTGCSYSAG
jgi:hypothetical protein